MVDKETVRQIFGSLMKKPHLFLERDKYNLSLSDFHTSFEQLIFKAVYNLFEGGAKRITVVDVDNYLMSNPGMHTFFEKKKGIQYLQDAEEFTESENFDYYYKRLKKLNAVGDLQEMGFNTSGIYSEDPFSDDTKKINDRFEEMSIQELFANIQQDISGLSAKYGAGSDTTETIDAQEGLAELVERLKLNPDVGSALQGHITNTVARGARKGKYYLRSAASGVGKALPNSTKIPTPLGWREVGEVRVGDYLFDALGKPTKVTGVFPQGKKEVWKVHFKDGRKAKSSPDHLWSYNTCRQRQKSKDERKFFTKTLKDIAAEELMSGLGYRILVPQHRAVEYGEKKLPIPPYVLGLAIGDGSFRQHDNNKSFQFSSETDELPRVIADTMGYTLKRNSEHNYTWYFGSQKPSGGRKQNIWVEDFLRELPELINTTSANKYIPEMYLYSSIEQRLDLLNGLLDSDGTVDKKGRVGFFTSSAKLRDNVTELASSLGYFVTVSEDNHRENINYIVRITGTPELKNKLFKLARKRERMEDWCNNGNRKERNTHNPIVDIVNLGYEEDMTCFMVDNEEHLFLTEDFIVTHNSRLAVGDACHLAYPIRFNSDTWSWELNGACEKTLFIATEQEHDEIQTLILAYLVDMDEEKILYGDYSEMEAEVIKQGLEVMEYFKNNLLLVQIPGPNVEKIKSTVRRNWIEYEIENVFFDYIFVNPSLLGEFRDLRLRNDEALLLLSSALKDIAVELQVFVMSSSQLNAKGDGETGEIRGESSLRGARALADKADMGIIVSRIKQEEKELLENTFGQTQEIPNLVFDIYKARRSRFTQVKVWSVADLGTCRLKDLFMTDASYNPVNDFQPMRLETLHPDRDKWSIKIGDLNGRL